MDINEEIQSSILRLNQKITEGTVTNDDFTATWTYVVLLPMYYYELVITESNHTKLGYNREQAVIYGLLVRIRKFLAYLRRYACKGVLEHEVAAMMGRAIFEANFRLQYYIEYPEDIENYYLDGFKAETEFEDLIAKRREERAQTGSVDKDADEYEEGLLKSIYDTYASVGLTSEQIRANKNKQKPVEQMIRALGYEDMYFAYRNLCHATHGDWQDAFKNNLKKTGDKFYPDLNDHGTDIRELNPITLISILTLEVFINDYPGHGLDISDELQTVKEGIVELEQLHSEYLLNQGR
ncbi:MAG: hypothetical protein IJ153_04215 [Clostridia bacterium]|nr:hypothetical protein [Clostridia bacterium]